ncbi:type II toxin-antitoxin system VapB family antitoxin [Prosthecomicrobium hirschii]|uniref:type II toxin-antitoxin system VapB family antitoxin n=1 Tax=Prosthecodimorpha hirschii TaxID=665126 RepID=UPI00221F8E16|nr:type II toxin-antitoxin system VapB family antitoxin [Prosthecomicrobium hirschii]MCW1840144.1 type II toxin-antitoxin system VapB family antitoxin [Prosthecomicrobium hirschii]
MSIAIRIDDILLAEAMAALGAEDGAATVATALRAAVASRGPSRAIPPRAVVGAAVPVAIDGDLLAEAGRAVGIESEGAVIEFALRQLIDRAARERALRELDGIGWHGDLDAIRLEGPGHAAP